MENVKLGKKPKKRKKSKIGLILISPYLILTIVFWCIPFVWSFILALQKWNMMSPAKFVWLKNFTKIFSDELFFITLRNTFQFISVFIPLSIAISLLIAWMIDKAKRGSAFFLISFLLPYVTAGVAYVVIFSRLFAYDGVVNVALRTIHVNIPFFTDPRIAMSSIALLVVWKIMGYYALIFYAGLQSIPQSLYDAALIDGATEKQTFFKITIPMLNASFVTILIFAIGLSVNIFTEPYLITDGGPFLATHTFVFWTYKTTFELFRAGQGSALAIITSAISFGLVFVVRRFVEKEVSL